MKAECRLGHESSRNVGDIFGGICAPSSANGSTPCRRRWESSWWCVERWKTPPPAIIFIRYVLTVDLFILILKEYNHLSTTLDHSYLFTKFFVITCMSFSYSKTWSRYLYYTCIQMYLYEHKGIFFLNTFLGHSFRKRHLKLSQDDLK